jgi:hypothetical protein
MRMDSRETWQEFLLLGNQLNLRTMIMKVPNSDDQALNTQINDSVLNLDKRYKRRIGGEKKS